MTREEEIIETAKFIYSPSSSIPQSLPMRVGFIEGAKWADSHPRKVYVVVRCEEHDDYIEKVFVDKAKANEYCNKFEGNPNEYGRYYEEMEVTL